MKKKTKWQKVAEAEIAAEAIERVEKMMAYHVRQLAFYRACLKALRKGLR